MIFRGSTSTGDWDWGRGKQSYLTGVYAIMKNIETRLKTFYSECFFNNDFGVPWFQLLGQKDTTPILYTLRDQVLDCYGVLSVNNVEFSLDADRNILITYSIDTIYTTNLTGTVTA